MKHLLPFAVLSACVGLAAADGSAPDRATDGRTTFVGDRVLIQGTWVFTAFEMDGKVLTDGSEYERYRKFKLTFTGDTVTNASEPDEPGEAVTVILFPDQKPPAMDVVVKDVKGRFKEKVQLLYEIEGPTLRLCFVEEMADRRRPTEFGSKNGQAILTFKRQ
jgi:uncharacterized protein (TIGR03067 family)